MERGTLGERATIEITFGGLPGGPVIKKNAFLMQEA